jgi:hypothetical protein
MLDIVSTDIVNVPRHPQIHTVFLLQSLIINPSETSFDELFELGHPSSTGMFLFFVRFWSLLPTWGHHWNNICPQLQPATLPFLNV